jgi:hypothetical protein
MKKIIFLLLFFIIGANAYSQTHSSKCKCTVVDVTKVVSFGYLVGYNALMKNASNKTIDGIYWTEVFYNNAGDMIEQSKSSFNSTSVIDPIQSGVSKNMVRTPRVKGASKVVIQIDKVHFTDGSTCK